MRLVALTLRLITFTRLFLALRTILAGLLIFFLWDESSVGAVIIGVLFFFIFPFLADFAFVIFSPEPMGFPACPNGCCTKRDDYQYRENKGIQTFPTYECRCGIVFLYYEKRFMRLDSDGIAHPYMIFKNRRERWMPDTGEPIDTKTAVLCEWAKEVADARAKKEQAETER
jgi:hypothetical protein